MSIILWGRSNSRRPGGWAIGREIVEVEQGGEERAGYGESLLKRLSSRLTKNFGRGFTVTTLKRIRQFYLAFPEGSSVVGPRALFAEDQTSGDIRLLDSALFPTNLSWTHYRLLVAIADPDARAFYEIEAAKEHWSARELERQVASLLYQRLSKSRDKVQVRVLAEKGQTVSSPRM